MIENGVRFCRGLESGKTSFDMDVSDNLYDKLQNAEEDGTYLDSDYISEEMPISSSRRESKCFKTPYSSIWEKIKDFSLPYNTEKS